MSGIVCFEKCWSCRLSDDHFDPPKWHTWADSEDAEWALANGHPDPRKSRCGCDCAVEPGAEDRREEHAAAIIAAIEDAHG
jgi:hypothetical protein